MKNVRNFMDYAIQFAGVFDHCQFIKLSPKHQEFWKKLTGLYLKKGIKVEEVENVDEATPLPDDEWDELDKELQSILTS